MMNTKVAILSCPSYDPELVYQALKEGVELAGGLDVAGKKVLLKPNIVFDAAPEKAVCTHPVFLGAAIRLVRELGASHIMAGDSPGLQGRNFRAPLSGLGEAAAANGAQWVDFTQAKAEVSSPQGRAMKKFSLTQAAAEADLIINLPKLKTHQLMYYTGAIKNLFGLVPSAAKSAFHVRFPTRNSLARALVDLNLALPRVYHLMDAIVAMEGPGPGSGDPKQLGLVLASSNALAMDIGASTILGYPPLRLPTNREALERGFWLKGPEEIEYPALKPAECRVSGFTKIPLKRSSSQLLEFILPHSLRNLKDRGEPGPQINRHRCVCCGDCADICASRAMDITGDPPWLRIDYKQCIRCFCCHEICPIGAIDIVKGAKNQAP